MWILALYKARVTGWLKHCLWQHICTHSKQLGLLELSRCYPGRVLYHSEGWKVKRKGTGSVYDFRAAEMVMRIGMIASRIQDVCRGSTAGLGKGCTFWVSSLVVSCLSCFILTSAFGKWREKKETPIALLKLRFSKLELMLTVWQFPEVPCCTVKHLDSWLSDVSPRCLPTTVLVAGIVSCMGRVWKVFSFHFLKLGGCLIGN